MDNSIMSRDWNASEALFAFLGYVSDYGVTDTLTFEQLVQRMQTFSEHYNLPPTRDGWMDGIRSRG